MPKKIHIALLTDCLENFAGGAEKQIYELAKGLDKSKYRISVVSLDCQGEASAQTIEAVGCQLRVFRVQRIYGLSGFIQGVRFYSFLRNTRVDILQTYHFSSDIWGTFWARLAGVKTIISNRRDMGFWRTNIHVQAYHFIDRWVTRVVVVSNSVKKMVMATENVPAEKIQVIYNGIEIGQALTSPSAVNGLGESLGIKANEKVIVHVANLKPVKGHAYLLEALAQAVKDLPDLKLLLIGKDELSGSLQRLAKELNISDKVIFLGRRTDIADLLVLADFCVLPSLSEGMSNSILEYMAAGKAVVATAVGGNTELVLAGESGLIVEKENVGQLARAILDLLINHFQCRMMGEKGLARVRELFSLQKMLKEYEQMYEVFCPSRTRVLHLISSGGMFGAEQVVLNLVNGAQVDPIAGVIHNHHNPHLELIQEAGKRNRNSVIFESRGRFDLDVVEQVRRYMVENKVDIIHTHNYKSDIVGFLAACLSAKRWVATNHVWHSTDEKMKFYEKIDAFVLRFARKVIAVSDEIAEDLRRKNIDNCRVVYNGIDVQRFQQEFATAALKKTLGIGEGDPVVSLVGRLSKEKGHKIFLSAAEQIVRKHPQVKFLIVGDGPLWDELKKATAASGLSSCVVFTGIRQDMPQIYALTDILVLPSLIEGLPMTILEAMASHLAIIATPVGAIPKVIEHDMTGVIVPVGDAPSLAREVIALLDNVQKRHELGEAAFRKVCEYFSAERMTRDYNEVYAEVLR